MQIIGVLGGGGLPGRSETALGTTLQKEEFFSASKANKLREVDDANITATSAYARSTFGSPKKKAVAEAADAIKIEPDTGKVISKPKKKERMKSRNKLHVLQVRTQQPICQPLPIKQMVMEQVNFGELVFGGNVQKNLKKEAKLTQTVQ